MIVDKLFLFLLFPKLIVYLGGLVVGVIVGVIVVVPVVWLFCLLELCCLQWA